MVFPVEVLGEEVGELEEVYELLGIEVAGAGTPVDKAVEVEVADAVENALLGGAEAEDVAALGHLVERGVELGIAPAGLRADYGAGTGKGDKVEAVGYPIELAVLADGVEEGLYQALAAAELGVCFDEGPEVGKVAARAEGVYRQAVGYEDIWDGARADLGDELGVAGGVVLVGVVFGVVADLDAVVAVHAVELEYLVLDGVVEAGAGEGEGGLLRDLVIGGLDEAYEVIGRAALVAVFGGEADDVAVFLGEHAGEVVSIDVAVYPGEELGLLAGVRVEAEEALALVVAEVVVPAEGVDAVDAAVEVHLVIDELAGLGVDGEELDFAVVVGIGEDGRAAVGEVHQAHETVDALARGDAVEQLSLEADAQQLVADADADAAVAVRDHTAHVEILLLVLVELGEVYARGLVALLVKDAQEVLFDIGELAHIGRV